MGRPDESSEQPPPRGDSGGHEHLSAAGDDPTRIQLYPDRTRSVVGETLNDLYQVHRLIARGGMGEVYEGTEVHTGERVAIKIILPHLAADPKMQQLFLREARALTHLSHPGLVQYRVFANDRRLGVFYIVTEFVDGPALSEVLSKIKAAPELILALAERLASALQSAHEAGQIHRDISPDNILLPQGRLEQAKIIDFGITKTLAAGHTTIIGDGFAGKLGYISPEQLAERPDDETPIVGPWTDVYALGLVLLAVARGQPAPMGKTLVEAVERRREVPDLTPVPVKLRPMFASMLAPDPAKRFRSMKDIVAAAGRIRDRVAEPKNRTARWFRSPIAWTAGGIGAAVIATMVVLAFWLRPYPTAQSNAGNSTPPLPSTSTTTLTVDAAGGGDFTRIADALTRARAGQRIQIRPGRYREPLLIAKNVSLAGMGPGVVIDSADHECAELGDGEVMIALSFETTTTDSCLAIRSGSPQLQGLTIRASNGVAMRVSGGATPAIADLTIGSAKGAGVVVGDRAAGRFERLRITSINGPGFVAAGHSAPIIAGGEISNAQGSGALFVEQARGSVQGLTIRDNTLEGIELGGESAPEVTGNTISNNAGSGILVRENALPHVADNTIRVNTLGGVVVTGNSAPNIEANRIEENLQAGIYLTNAAGGTVSRNQIVSNKSFGIAVDEKSQVQLIANQLSKNKPPQLVTRSTVQAKFENNIVTP